MSEFQKDKDFLQAIYKDFRTQFNKRPDPMYAKYRKDNESYADFLVNNQKELKLSLKNYDTSASCVRQLRQAEQELQSPSFLEDLAKTLADSLSETNDSAYSGSADIIKGFEMDINWNLMSELKKDEEKGSLRGMI